MQDPLDRVLVDGDDRRRLLGVPAETSSIGMGRTLRSRPNIQSCQKMGCAVAAPVEK